MSMATNREVEFYWANQLAQAGVLVEILQATKIKLIDRDSHDDPPDALFEVYYNNSDSHKLWCEIVGAWISEEYARMTFQIAEGRREPPEPLERNGLIQEPDLQIAWDVRRKVEKKLQKQSYEKLVSKYGLGHLHLFVSRDGYRLFDGTTVTRILDELPIQRLECQATFRSVSLGWNDRVLRLWDDKHGLATTSMD